MCNNKIISHWTGLSPMIDNDKYVLCGSQTKLPLRVFLSRT